MVLMEESEDKLTLVIDRDPEGLSNIVESSRILEAAHVREVSDTHSIHRLFTHIFRVLITTNLAALERVYFKIMLHH